MTIVPIPDSDPLAIPLFLRVDAAEAARRRKYWEEHPPVAVTFGPPVKTEKEATISPELLAQIVEDDKNQNARLIKTLARSPDSKKARDYFESRKPKAGPHMDRGTWREDLTGYRFDTTCCKWVPDPDAPDPRAPAKKKAASAAKVKPPEAATTTRAPATGGRKSTAEKQATVIAMLERAEGATLEEIAPIVSPNAFTHSASAFLSGIRKMGRPIKRTDEARGSVYRFETAATM